MGYLDATNDFLFKLLFREPSDERRLISLLTAVLDPPVPITNAEVLNPEIAPEEIAGKAIVLDLLVRLDDGRTVDVEMESIPRPLFIPRNVFYWARAHARQLSKGADYAELRPTVSIAWLASPPHARTGILESDRVHSRYRIKETSTGAELTDQFEMHYLDLRNLGRDATLSRPLRRWAEFFDHPTNETLGRLSAEDAIMADTIRKLDEVLDDEGLRRIAEARWLGELAQWQDLRHERKEGRAEGLVEGRAEGLVEGRALGLRTALGLAIEARFGRVPAEVHARLEAASIAELERLLPRVLAGLPLEELFAADP